MIESAMPSADVQNHSLQDQDNFAVCTAFPTAYVNKQIQINAAVDQKTTRTPRCVIIFFPKAQRMLSWVKGLTWTILVGLSGPLLFVSVILPSFLIRNCISEYSFRSFVDFWYARWCALVGIMFQFWGVRFHLPNPTDIQLEKMRNTRNWIVVCNHPSRLDWLFLWSWWYRFGSLQHQKIILKNDIQQFPFFGAICNTIGHIFLSRRIDKDKEHIQNALSYHLSTQRPVQILMFPEGTNMSTESKKKSDAFATAQKKDKYMHVLHPRTTGFHQISNSFNKDETIVIDLTLSYETIHKVCEKNLISGRWPFLVSIRTSDVEYLSKINTEWLQNQWRLKEDYLRKEKELDGCTRPPIYQEPFVGCPTLFSIFGGCCLLYMAYLAFWNYFWYSAMYTILAMIAYHILKLDDQWIFSRK